MAGKPQERPHASWSDRRLSGYICTYCDQPLHHARRGHCGAIYHGVSDCHWFKELNATPNSGEVKS